MKRIHSQDADFPELWNELLKKCSDYDCYYSPLAQNYFRAYFSQEGPFEDHSLIVMDGPTPVLGMALFKGSSPDSRMVGAIGKPARVFTNDSVNAHQLNLAYDCLKEWLTESIQSLIGAGRSKSFQFLSTASVLSPFDHFLLAQGAKLTTKVVRQIDLRPDEDFLKSQIRKSFKSLINWGESNIQWLLLEDAQASHDEWQVFRRLHIEVAGRETRPSQTWDCQLKMIQNREAFALLGKINGKLETGALFFLHHRDCNYGASASNRELFEKPLLHAALWRAIRIAKSRGAQSFTMGDQFFLNHPSHSSKKEADISTFKRGFGGISKFVHVFEIPADSGL